MMAERTIRANSFAVGAEHQENARRDRHRLAWRATLGICASAGTASMISGLFLSVLTACRVLDNSRYLSVTVTALLITGLSLLLCAAHAMDRIDEIKRADEDR
jgi:hypothetical protein